MQGSDWRNARAFAFVVRLVAPDGSHAAAGVLINGREERCSFRLPGDYGWRLAFVSCSDCSADRALITMAGPAVACLAAATASD